MEADPGRIERGERDGDAAPKPVRYVAGDRQRRQRAELAEHRT